MKTKMILLVAGGFLANASLLSAVDYTFAATAGMWGSYNNWNPIGIPGNGDNAVIPNGKTCTVYLSQQALTVDVQSGGTLKIDGSTDPSYGENKLKVNGTLDVQSGGTLIIDGGTDADYGGAVLEVLGTCTIDGSATLQGVYPLLSLSGGATVGNSGMILVKGSKKNATAEDPVTRYPEIFLDNDLAVNGNGKVQFYASGSRIFVNRTLELGGTGTIHALSDQAEVGFNNGYITLADITCGTPLCETLTISVMLKGSIWIWPETSGSDDEWELAMKGTCLVNDADDEMQIGTYWVGLDFPDITVSGSGTFHASAGELHFDNVVNGNVDSNPVTTFLLKASGGSLHFEVNTVGFDDSLDDYDLSGSGGRFNFLTDMCTTGELDWMTDGQIDVAANKTAKFSATSCP